MPFWTTVQWFNSPRLRHSNTCSCCLHQQQQHQLTSMTRYVNTAKIHSNTGICNLNRFFCARLWRVVWIVRTTNHAWPGPSAGGLFRPAIDTLLHVCGFWASHITLLLSRFEAKNNGRRNWFATDYCTSRTGKWKEGKLKMDFWLIAGNLDDDDDDDVWYGGIPWRK